MGGLRCFKRKTQSPTAEANARPILRRWSVGTQKCVPSLRLSPQPKYLRTTVSRAREGERRGERTGRSFAVGEICTELDFVGMDLAPTPPSFFAGPSSPLCPWIWPRLLACCAYAPTDLNLATRMAKAYSWPHAGPSFNGFFAFCYVPWCYAGGFELGHSHAQCLFLGACWI